MRRLERSSTWILIVSLVTMIGCAPVGNFFIPPHKNSDTRGRDRVSVTLSDQEPLVNRVAPFAAAAIVAVAGLAIDQVAKGIESESKRYKATYSGRTRGILLSRRGDAISLGAKQVKIIRTIRPNENEPIEAINVTIGIFPTFDKGAIYLQPIEVEMLRSKAKVAWPRWWSLLWTWWMYPWMGLDKDAFSIDVNVQLELEVIASTETARKASPLGTVDFHLGKCRVDRLTGSGKDGCQWNDRFEELTSPFLGLPVLDGNGDGDLLLNVRATVIESNDLGDVIAKGSKEVKDRREDLLEKLKEKLENGEDE